MMYTINYILFAYILTSFSILVIINMFNLNKVYTKLNSDEHENFIEIDEESYYESYEEDNNNVANNNIDSNLLPTL